MFHFSKKPDDESCYQAVASSREMGDFREFIDKVLYHKYSPAKLVNFTSSTRIGPNYNCINNCKF